MKSNCHPKMHPSFHDFLAILEDIQQALDRPSFDISEHWSAWKAAASSTFLRTQDKARGESPSKLPYVLAVDFLGESQVRRDRRVVESEEIWRDE